MDYIPDETCALLLVYVASILSLSKCEYIHDSIDVFFFLQQFCHFNSDLIPACTMGDLIHRNIIHYLLSARKIASLFARRRRLELLVI